MAIESVWVELTDPFNIVRVNLATGAIEQTLTREDVFGPGASSVQNEALFHPAMTPGLCLARAEVSGVTSHGVLALDSQAIAFKEFGFSAQGLVPVSPLSQAAWISSDQSTGAIFDRDVTYRVVSFSYPAMQELAATPTGEVSIAGFVVPSGNAVVYKGFGTDNPWVALDASTGSQLWTLPDSFSEDRRLRDSKYLVVGLPGNERIVMRSEADNFDLQVVDVATGASSILTGGFFDWIDWSNGARWVCHNPLNGDAVGQRPTGGGLVLVKNDYSVVTNPGGDLTAVGSVQFDISSNKYYLFTTSALVYEIEPDFSAYTLIRGVGSVQRFLGFSSDAAPPPPTPSFWAAFNKTREVIE